MGVEGGRGEPAKAASAGGNQQRGKAALQIYNKDPDAPRTSRRDRDRGRSRATGKREMKTVMKTGRRREQRGGGRQGVGGWRGK